MENSTPDKNSRAVDGVIQENHGLVVVKVGAGNQEAGSQEADNLGTDSQEIDSQEADNLGTDSQETDSQETDSQGTAILQADKEHNEITDKDSKELLTSGIVNSTMRVRLRLRW